MQNNGSYPNFGGFSQTLGVNAKILGFYTLGTHFSWGYPNFVDLPKMCYLDVAGRLSERGSNRLVLKQAPSSSSDPFLLANSY